MKGLISFTSFLIISFLLKYRQCKNCNDGQYLNTTSQKCHNCYIGCKKCSNYNKCSECKEDYFFDSNYCYKCNYHCKETSDNCKCNSCDDIGYYLTSHYQCYSCHSNCIKCSGPTYKCETCKDNYFLDSNSCYECDYYCKTKKDECRCKDCDDGRYLTSHDQCHSCDSNCETCSGSSDKCLSCYKNFFLHSNKCYECRYNCRTTSDGCQCNSCNDGYYLTSYYQCHPCNSKCKTCSGSSTYCLTCKEGYYLSQNFCIQCSNFCKICSGANICTSCINNNYFLDSGKCYKCNINNCKKTEDNCKCDICNDGYYLEFYQCKKCSGTNCKTCSGQDDTCSSCIDGYYLNYENFCKPCISPCKTCSNETMCDSCIEDYFLYLNTCYKCNINCKTTSDNCTCDSCPDGFYLNNYQCLICDPNCKTCLGLPNNCTSCSDGNYLDSNNSCSKCIEPCHTCFNENICTSCIEGYFLFSDECLLCNISCKTSNDNCKCDSCEGGYYLKNYQCINCAESNCKECPGGYNKFIKEENKCTNNCKNNLMFQFEYNYTCYLNCPNDTYVLEDKEDYLCYDEVPEGYYLDKENSIYKKCYETCNKCNKGGNKYEHNCSECKSNHKYYLNPNNISNCYEICEDFYYFDELNEFHCIKACQGKYNKTIIEKKICINECKNDDTYKYEYKNYCNQECPNGTITNENKYMCYDIPSNVKNEQDLEIEKFRNMISGFDVTKNKEDIISQKDNVLYQITTSDNQRNNTNKNMSTIDLGLCEDELKTQYHIDPSLPLIIFKIDYFTQVTQIPIIGYEIYHPITKEKLNLSYCEDIFIKLNIPVNIDENSLYKYDPNSQFYQDNCFAYTTENGTDIIISDRKQEFSDNKLSLCESNCNYTGYDGDNKQSSCDCNIKNKMDTISELMENPIQLSNNFESEESSTSASSNIISIKCTKALFSKDGLKSNISSYILIIFIMHFLLSIILFLKCGYPLLVKDVNDIMYKNEKEEKRNKKKTIFDEIRKSKGNNKKKEKKIGKRKTNYPPKKFKGKIINNINSHDRNSKKRFSSIQLGRSKKNDGNINLNKNNQNNFVITTNKKGKKPPPEQKEKKESKIKFNDYELNSLDYIDALSYDRRTCSQYYLALIKTKNSIIFSFCPRNDYNSIIIRSCIFSLSFSVYYAINFVFFTDNTMHKIYEDGGKYDIIYFMPKILISFFVSYYITIILKMIFLSERNIAQVRRQSSLSIAYDIANKVKRNLIIKYTLFFILGLIFLVFFWMLLSSFGAVYPNTQMFIFKNALISFAISLVYPFFFNVFPTGFRMCSLKSNNSECIYKVSKFLQML